MDRRAVARRVGQEQRRPSRISIPFRGGARNAMTFLIRILQGIFSSSRAAENGKLLAIFMLLGLLASVLLAQTSLALDTEWRKPF